MGSVRETLEAAGYAAASKCLRHPDYDLFFWMMRDGRIYGQSFGIRYPYLENPPVTSLVHRIVTDLKFIVDFAKGTTHSDIEKLNWSSVQFEEWYQKVGQPIYAYPDTPFDEFTRMVNQALKANAFFGEEFFKKLMESELDS